MSRRILLVDEEPVAMEYYVDALKEGGFEVTVCDTCSNAVDIARALNPDLIVLDIMMPPGDKYREDNHHDGLRTGFFVLRDLRACFPDITVIVLTNVTDRETLGVFESGELLRVLGKPECPPFTLLELVRSILGPEKGKIDRL